MGNEPAKKAPETPATPPPETKAPAPAAAPPAEKKDLAVAPEAPKAPEAEAKTETKTPEQKTVVPEKYDLKLPEGSPFNAAHVEKIAAFAKAQGFSNEQAQGVLEREHAAVADYVEGQKGQLKQIQESWMPAAQADKEIGGLDFGKNAELANRVIERFGTPELKKALSETSYGNHPELVRVFVRIGKAMSEDQLVTGAPGAGGGKKSAAELFYPNQQEK